jgi:hypothetical protein
MVRKQRAYRRSVRKQQIIKQLKIWHQNDYAKEATSYMLANALDMVVSTTFIGILKEMVAEGDLEVVEREQPGRWVTHFYLLANSHLITEKFSRRHISVRSRGRAVGQLEMFS